MGRASSRALWLVLGTGLAIRLVLAFTTVGQAYDVENLRLAGQEFIDHALSLYRHLDTGGRAGPFVLYRWPYPPGYLPFAALAVEVAKAVAIPFHAAIKLLPIAADLVIAFLVQAFLGRRGASDRVRLAAAALVALGPSFIVISGYHGQVDPVAICPAVGALYVWETSGSPRRALWAGVLVGVAASIKTVPVIMLAAMLPSARSVREAAGLLAAAGTVILAVVAPYLIADHERFLYALGYAGGPGLGGLSMLIQPGLTKAYLTGVPTGLSDVTRVVYDHASLIVAVAVGAAGVFVLRFRPRALQAAVFLWLVVYVFNPNFFTQYIVWGLPFFVMAGHLVEVAAMQLVLVPVSVLFYGIPWSHPKVVIVYVAIMGALWLAWVAGLGLSGAAIARRMPLKRWAWRPATR